MAATSDVGAPAGPDRLDRAIAARGLAPSRERAQMLIRAGLVRVDGQIAERPSQPVQASAVIEITGEALPYVGRGGLKLESALKRFRLNVQGALCLDVGASTGGFTDCLLQRGARKVVAIEVGHGQMHPRLRDDPRVELRERANARHLQGQQFEMPFDLAVIDVSFISLTLVLPAVAPLVRPGGHLVALVKPEFEAGRGAVDSRGVVRDPEARRAATLKVIKHGRDELGLSVRGTEPALRMGANRETFVCFRVHPPAGDGEPSRPSEAPE
ncbi:MAG TPA: TlyA family RNA methyltransferase [Chthonomonadales bacterium]|nr:TlyA family RNA methyltransferase [Chthonomonadales bacterium]